MLAFSVTVSLLVLVSWLTLAFIEVCMLGSVDEKFDCASSLQIVFAFSLIGAGLSGAMAFALRVALATRVPAASVTRECKAGALAGIVLVLVFYGIIDCKIGMNLPLSGRMAIWLAVTAAVCSLSLTIADRLGKRPKPPH